MGERMMRIAFLANPHSPNGWYRGIGPMVALGAVGHEIRQLLRPRDDFRPQLIQGCDVLHIHREHDERALELVRYAKRAGMTIVWDNDDDLTAVPKEDSSYREFGGLAGERSRRAVQKILEAADLATAPSAALAERLRELGAREVRVIENYVRDEALEVRRQRGGDEIVFGWLAGLEHHLDVRRVPIADAVQRLLDAHEHVRVVTVGTKLGLRHERYEHREGVDFMAIPQLLAEFDVGFAVIADIPMNRARSNLKLKEYAAVGIPWLASPIGPYAGMGEEQGGRLVPDDGWFEAFERLALHARGRRKLAKRARAWGRKQTLLANVGAWEQALREAAAA